jgi:hypothetical protein
MREKLIKIVFGLLVITANLMADNQALIIGCCSEYKSSKLNPYALKGTKNDAKAIHKLLIENGNVLEKNSVILIEKDATRLNILKELKALLNKPNLKRGDKVYLYYSGHGTSPADRKFMGQRIKTDEKLKEWLENSTALIPYDGNPKDILNSFIITKRDIKPILKKLDDRGIDVVWIVDACFGGNAYRSASVDKSSKTMPFSFDNAVLEEDIDESLYKNLLFYSASLSTLPTSEKIYNGKVRGEFTYILEQCLSKPNSRGYIKHKDLKNCLNVNYGNAQVQPNYYPLSDRLDDKIVMRVPKITTQSKVENKYLDYKDLLFKLTNDKPILDVDVKSLNSTSEVIKVFCRNENIKVELKDNTLKYVLAFSKDRDGKVIMLQPNPDYPLRGGSIVEAKVIPPFGKDELKIFTTNDPKVYRVAEKFVNNIAGVLSNNDVKEIYEALKNSGDFRTRNITIETIDKDVSECKKGD